MKKKMTEREKALSGYLFMSGIPSLKVERDREKDLCYELNLCRPSDEEKRQEILRELIGEIKGKFYIASPFYCDYGTHITIWLIFKRMRKDQIWHLGIIPKNAAVNTSPITGS